MPREASEGTSEFPFFRPFFVEQQRKGIKVGTARREAVRAWGEEVAENLAKLPSLLPSILALV